MKLLSLETATPAGAVALLVDDTLVGEVLATTKREHTETLLPAALGLLAQAGLCLVDLDAVVVDIGPGLFTGLRVGVASARSLASAAGIGIETVSSTEVLAHDDQVASANRVLSCLDAARGEVFAEVFDAGHSVAGPVVLRPEQVAEWCSEHGGGIEALIGSALDRYAEHLGGIAEFTVLQAYPSPGVAAHLVAARGLRGGDPAEVVPNYLRDPDAVANFQVAPVGQRR